MANKKDKREKRLKHQRQKAVMEAAQEAAAINSPAEPCPSFPRELSPAWERFYNLIANAVK